MNGKTIKVLCVDDHEFLVEGLRSRLEIEDDMEFVGRLTTAEGLIEQVRRTGADVVLVDIDMPGPDVFDSISQLHRAVPDARAVVLSAHVRDKYLNSAHRAGAWGYLSKADPPSEIIDCIRRVGGGEHCFSSSVIKRAGSVEATEEAFAGSRLSLLTARELQVLRLIAKGMSRTAIAEQLCRSPMTIDNHRKAIMRKLDLHDRAELVRYAIAEGLVEV